MQPTPVLYAGMLFIAIDSSAMNPSLSKLLASPGSYALCNHPKEPPLMLCRLSISDNVHLCSKCIIAATNISKDVTGVSSELSQLEVMMEGLRSANCLPVCAHQGRGDDLGHGECVADRRWCARRLVLRGRH
jgi:hypothetical protein